MGHGSTAEPHSDGVLAGPSPNEITDVLLDLWRKRRPEVVADLERLITLFTDWTQSDGVATKSEIVTLAHQLHGALGVFGWNDLKEQLCIVEQSLITENPNINDLISIVRVVASDLP